MWHSRFALHPSATALNSVVISDSSLSFHAGVTQGAEGLCKAQLHLIDKIQSVTAKPKGANGSCKEAPE